MHNENWMAFAVCVVSATYISPDRAFRRLSGEEKPGKITKEDIEEMIFLKNEEGYRYNTIATIYGIKYSSVVDYVRRYSPKRKYREEKEK